MSVDLNASYGGLSLCSPVIVGACPLTADETMRMALQRAGAGAIVLPSLFEEQVVRWSGNPQEYTTDPTGDLLLRSHRLQVASTCGGADSYLAMVNRASVQLDIPVIASLNGYSASGWLDFAGELEEAGAGAIELNVHHAAACEYYGSDEIEQAIIAAATQIKASVSIPVFIKLDRTHISVPHLARRLLSGIDGMVLFGRQPDIDICLDSLQVRSKWSLTQDGTIVERLATIMEAHSLCPAMPIAACGGIGQADSLIKALLAGADVGMVTSAIYRNGPEIIRSLTDGLIKFMQKAGLHTLLDLQLRRPLEFASSEERAAYIASLSAKFADAQTAEFGAIQGDRWGHCLPMGP